MTNGEYYQERAGCLIDFASDLGDSQRLVATPDWNVWDLLAHLAGVAVDVVAGNVGSYAQPSWTALQVASRQHRSRESVIIEWRNAWEAMSQLLDDPLSCGLDASFSVLPVADLLAHEHDLRESVGVAGFADPDVWWAVEGRRREVLAVQCAKAGCGLEIRTPEGDHWLVGPNDPRLSVTAPRYDLWRSLEGRRTRSVVRDFDWQGDPDPFLEYWVGSIFHWPDDACD